MAKTETAIGCIMPLDELSAMDKYANYLHLADYVYHSNRIENIITDYIGTHSEENPFIPQPEFSQHYETLEYVFHHNAHKSPREDDIKFIHGIMMQGLLDNAGQYRKQKLWIGRMGTVHYQQIPKLMDSLESQILELETKEKVTREDIWHIHNSFELIHPFTDGNGRTGRLLLNWLSLRHLQQFETIHWTKRWAYYDIIEADRQVFRKSNPGISFYRNFSKKKWHELNKKREDNYRLYMLKELSKYDFK